MNNSKIKAYIVDDEPYSIDLLSQELSNFKQIQLVGYEMDYFKARNSIIELKPDVIFLDIEMPQKSGFELLHELRLKMPGRFHCIFHTAYDKYSIQALRESAFDYILKPVKAHELKSAIDRLYQSLHENLQVATSTVIFPSQGEIITFPTHTGVRFFKTHEIIYIYFEKEKGWKKGYWFLYLYDHQVVRLRSGLNSAKLNDMLADKKFLQINQSTLINLNYVSSIEQKSQECMFLPPYNNIILKISRHYMKNVREQFDFLL